MRNFTRPDELHFQAAVGWLELGNWSEADAELEQISPQMRAHPEVLQVRCKVYCEAQLWNHAAEVANGLCRMVPESSFGPLHLAHALRKLGRTAEARDALVPIADKFPDEWRVPFQLACYSCVLGRKKEALKWLGLAIDIAGKVDIRSMALDEPDLESLWVDISEI